MRDLTPLLKVGTRAEADLATFGVVFTHDPDEAAVIINAGACAMVPNERIAVEVLELLGVDQDQIAYLLEPPGQFSLPDHFGCWRGAIDGPPPAIRRFCPARHHVA